MSSAGSDRRLYGMGSPNVRKVGLMLEELGLEYDLHHVAVFGGEQFEPVFLAMNPLGKVPVLIDPGSAEPLYESCAILIYLAETYGGGLLPEEGRDRREVLRWLMVQTALVGPMLGQYNHYHLVVAHGTERYSAARYRNQAEEVYRQLELRLSERDWLAGECFSIADIATWPWALYLERHDFSAADFPALIQWRDAISGRPTAIRMLARFAEAFDERSNRIRRAATPGNLDRFFNRKPDGPIADFSPIVRA